MMPGRRQTIQASIQDRGPKAGNRPLEPDDEEDLLRFLKGGLVAK